MSSEECPGRGRAVQWHPDVPGDPETQPSCPGLCAPDCSEPSILPEIAPGMKGVSWLEIIPRPHSVAALGSTRTAPSLHWGQLCRASRRHSSWSPCSFSHGPFFCPALRPPLPVPGAFPNKPPVQNLGQHNLFFSNAGLPGTSEFPGPCDLENAKRN